MKKPTIFLVLVLACSFAMAQNKPVKKDTAHVVIPAWQLSKITQMDEQLKELSKQSQIVISHWEMFRGTLVEAKLNRPLTEKDSIVYDNGRFIVYQKKTAVPKK